MNHIELFSGIGGFRRAMDLIERDHKITFNCLGFSEIDLKAKITYRTNYNTKGEFDMGDIVTFNENNDDVTRNLNIDLITGGFPCQSFSMMGKQLGFEDERGQMFFQIRHILKVKKEQGFPVPFLLLENVKNLFTHDNKKTYQRIKQELEDLGYKVFADIFNAAAFRQAQVRNRVIIFATLKDLPSDFEFTFERVKSVFDSDYTDSWSIFSQTNVLDVLDKDVDEKYYLSEKIKPTILSDGSGNFKSKSDINKIIARPLTASMHKMHRACQDNYYSEDFIKSHNPLAYLERVFSKEELQRQRIRKLTPEESFNLQGFPKSFATSARNAGVANGALYKQAGNAVSVNTIYAVFYYIFVKTKIL